jgi:type II secretory pathway component PulF
MLGSFVVPVFALLDDTGQNMNNAAAGAMLAGLGIGYIIFLIVVVLFMLWIYSRIFSKMGFSPWTCLLMIIPLVNIVWFIALAFIEWPIERRH